jgi:hypothetical protein
VYLDNIDGQAQYTDLTGAVLASDDQLLTLTRLVVGDRILVGPNNGSDWVDYAQLTADGAQSSGLGTFTVNGAIPADTPSSGTVRVMIDGVRERLAYASWSGSAFALTGTLPGNVLDGAEAYISYIDKVAASTTESVAMPYSGPRDLVVIVRDGGVTPIESFETVATFGASGASVAVIREPSI